MEFGILVVVVFFLIILLKSIIQVNEYERGIKFNRGKFSKIIQPGWRIIIPIIESYKKVTMKHLVYN